MSTINIFSNTIIQTNGDELYQLTSSDTNSLKHIEIESKDSSTININLSEITYESVAFKADSDLGESTLKWLENVSDDLLSVVSDRTLTCDDDLKTTYIDVLNRLISKGYDISLGDVYVTDLALSPLSISEAGTYNVTVSLTPSNANKYDISWDVALPDGITYKVIDQLHIQLTVSDNTPISGDVYITARDSYTGVNISSVTAVDIHVHISQMAISGYNEITDAAKQYQYAVIFEPSNADEYDIHWALGEAVDGVSIDDKGVLTVSQDMSVHADVIVSVYDNVSGVETHMLVRIDTVVYITYISPSTDKNITEKGTYGIGLAWSPSSAELGTLTWTLSPEVEGISLDKYTGQAELLTVSTSYTGTITMSVHDSNSGLTGSFDINMAIPEEKIHITSMTVQGGTSITSAAEYLYSVSYLPTNADEYDIQYSLSESLTGVSIDETTGQLTVSDDVYGNVEVIATDSVSGISASLSVAINTAATPSIYWQSTPYLGGSSFSGTISISVTPSSAVDYIGFKVAPTEPDVCTVDVTDITPYSWGEVRCTVEGTTTKATSIKLSAIDTRTGTYIDSTEIQVYYW